MSVPSDKPLASLTQFAAKLGWADLRIYQHTIDDINFAPQPAVVTWYESGVSEGYHNDFFLQINESPYGQTATYVGAVYALRYRICTGWHAFTLYDTFDKIAAEAERVECWIHRRWFETLAMRRQFRNHHPECAGYSWPRIRDDGPPYSLYEPGTA